MTGKSVKAMLWGLLAALYLGYGLAPTGWLFYQASFALKVDALYMGYQLLRGGDYLLRQSALLVPACIGFGVLAALLVFWRLSRKERS